MRIWKTGAIAAAMLPLAIAQALAAGKDVSSAEVQYQAGSSPLANVEMYQDINPKAPPLPYQEQINKGRFVVKTFVGQHVSTAQTRVTTKGQAYLNQRYGVAR